MSDTIISELKDRLKVAEANADLRRRGIAEAESKIKALAPQLTKDEELVAYYKEQLQQRGIE